jgi:hypothetical protein
MCSLPVFWALPIITKNRVGGGGEGRGITRLAESLAARLTFEEGPSLTQASILSHPDSPSNILLDPYYATASFVRWDHRSPQPPPCLSSLRGLFFRRGVETMPKLSFFYSCVEISDRHSNYYWNSPTLFSCRLLWPPHPSSSYQKRYKPIILTSLSL